MSTPIQVLNYRGKSPVSKIIRWLTRSQYSHSALRINFHFKGVNSRGEPVHILPGNVIEAWTESLFDKGSVRVTKDFSNGHTPGTPVMVLDAPGLTSLQEKAIAEYACMQVGKPYDWLHVLLFVPLFYLLVILKKVKLKKELLMMIKKFFCSMLVMAAFKRASVLLFNETEIWEVPPDWMPRSLRLRKNELVITT